MEMRGHHLKPSSGISWLANQYILASVIDLQSDRVSKIELLHSVCAARVWSTVGSLDVSSAGFGHQVLIQITHCPSKDGTATLATTPN